MIKKGLHLSTASCLKVFLSPTLQRGIEKTRTLINSYSVAQWVQLDGNKGVSQQDIDAEETKSGLASVNNRPI